jgi:hypothetical protein
MEDITTRLRQYGNTGEPLLLQEDTILEEAAGEIVRLRLTDEEREAVERLCEAVAEYSEIDRQENGCHADDDMAAVAVARGLLERTQQVGPASVERPSAARVADVGGAGPTK